MQKLRIIILFLALFYLSKAQGICSPLYSELKQYYRDFCSSHSSEKLLPENCLQITTDFYSALMDKKINTNNLRIVFMARAPKGHKIFPIILNSNFLSENAVRSKNRICHAFICNEDIVFDPYFKDSPSSLDEYFSSFWSKDVNLPNFWIFAIKLKDFPYFAGFSKKNGAPKLMEFEPVNYNFFIENPQHLSKRKIK